MSTERIGNFNFQLNRNGRPYMAIAYYCRVTGEQLSLCTECNHFDPSGVELDMLNWYNDTFLQMQDRIVTAGRLNDNEVGVRNAEDHQG